MLHVAVSEFEYAVLDLVSLDLLEVGGYLPVLVLKFHAREESCTLVVHFEAVEVSIHVEYFASWQGDFHAVSAFIRDFDFREVAPAHYSSVVLEHEFACGAGNVHVEAGDLLAVRERYYGLKVAADGGEFADVHDAVHDDRPHGLSGRTGLLPED